MASPKSTADFTILMRAQTRTLSQATARRQLRALGLAADAEDFSTTYLPPRIRRLLETYRPLNRPPKGDRLATWEALLQEEPEPWTPGKKRARKIVWRPAEPVAPPPKKRKPKKAKPKPKPKPQKKAKPKPPKRRGPKPKSKHPLKPKITVADVVASLPPGHKTERWQPIHRLEWLRAEAKRRNRWRKTRREQAKRWRDRQRLKKSEPPPKG
jgi:hypothetical protein